MSGLTLHDDIDRLDTGITQNPTSPASSPPLAGAAGVLAPS